MPLGMDDGISEAESLYDCCECCDLGDGWHVSHGRNFHADPCEGGCNDEED